MEKDCPVRGLEDAMDRCPWHPPYVPGQNPEP